MFDIKRHLYHRFLGPSIAFWINDELEEGNSHAFVIDDIDLYYQPVYEPILASIFCAIKVILVITGWTVGIKVWKMVNRENGLVKEVTKISTLAMMIYGPFLAVFSTSTDFIHPLNEVIGKWYCDVAWFIIYFLWFIISFHSFIVASMRYLFIVQEKKVEAFGKKKVKRIFHILAILLPLIMMIWSITDKTDVDAISVHNKCYGSHHKVFLFDTSTSKVATRNFCELVEYDEHGYFGKVISSLRRYACIVRTLIILVMGFNFTEGFIYYKILKHIFK